MALNFSPSDVVHVFIQRKSFPYGHLFRLWISTIYLRITAHLPCLPLLELDDCSIPLITGLTALVVARLEVNLGPGSESSPVVVGQGENVGDSGNPRFTWYRTGASTQCYCQVQYRRNQCEIVKVRKRDVEFSPKLIPLCSWLRGGTIVTTRARPAGRLSLREIINGSSAVVAIGGSVPDESRACLRPRLDDLSLVFSHFLPTFLAHPVSCRRRTLASAGCLLRINEEMTCGHDNFNAISANPLCDSWFWLTPSLLRISPFEGKLVRVRAALFVVTANAGVQNECSDRRRSRPGDQRQRAPRLHCGL
ncbi:hypothetical protein J6590_034257 [Homalodisca vitripennis]|nr:hypothetical protein J6590_034257 [Homalodisca vitripennis]